MRRSICLAAVLAVSLSPGFAGSSANAADLYWDSASSLGSWVDAGGGNWATASGGPAYTSDWAGGSTAHFEGTAGTVAVSGSIASVPVLSFHANGYAIAGGSLSSGPGVPLTVTVPSGVTATIQSQVTVSGITSEANPGWTLGGGGNLNLNGYCGPLDTTADKGLITWNGGGTLTINGTLSNYYNGGNAQTDKLRIGNTSGTNSVVVNGRMLSNTITLGESTYGGNTLTVQGGGSDGTPTVVGSGSNIGWVIGGSSSGNRMTVTAGANLQTNRGNGTNTFRIGSSALGTSNSCVITGAGARWRSTTAISVGYDGSSNNLTIADSAFAQLQRIYAGESAGDSNTIVVEGTGSILQTDNSSNSIVVIGQGSSGAAGNSLTIRNGGTANLRTPSAGRDLAIGANNGCDNNAIVVTGANSQLLTNGTTSNPLAIGGRAVSGAATDSTATGNHLDVFDGASATLTTGAILLGTSSAINLGNGSAVSTTTVGMSSFGSGIALNKASAMLNINNGRLSTTTPGLLASGAGSLSISNSAYFNIALLSAGVSQITSPIFGSGQLIKEGTSVLELTMAPAYSGPTVVQGGVLQFNSLGLADAADVQIQGGQLSLNFSGTDTIHSLYLNGVAQSPGYWGSLASGAPNTSELLQGNGWLYVTAAGAPAFSGTAAWNAASGGAWSDTANWTDLVSPGGVGAPGIAGSGSTQLARFDSLAAGSVAVTLGASTPAPGAIAFAGTTGYTIGGATGAGKLILTGGSTTATVDAVGAASHALAVPVQLASNCIVNVAGSSTLAISGEVTGTGGLTKSGTSTLVLSSTANTFSGDLAIASGVLQVSRLTNTINGRDAITLGSGSVLRVVGGNSATDRAIVLDGDATLDVSTTTNAEPVAFNGGISGTNRNLVLSGDDAINGGEITAAIVLGTGSLTKIGSGVWVLGASNSFSGGTTVTAGTLIVTNAGGLLDGTSLTIGEDAASVFPAPVPPPPPAMPVTAVPEPGAAGLLAAGMVVAALYRWRRWGRLPTCLMRSRLATCSTKRKASRGAR